MNKYIVYIVMLGLAISFNSCEKMVDLELNSIEPQLVIDAAIEDGKVCVVKLSLTQDYFERGSAQYVSGAKVYLSFQNGMATGEEQLFETAKGIYTSVMQGTIGYTYTLKVVVNDKEYKSTATIPHSVPIDKLYIYSLELDGKYWFNPCVAFYDPVDVANYYYYILTINDKKMSNIYVDDDIYSNGIYHNRLLIFDKAENDDEDLKYGDDVEVELQSIDEGAFVFFQSLNSIASGGGTNPIGNISGGVLGCFKAYSSSSSKIYHISENDVYSREL